METRQNEASRLQPSIIPAISVEFLRFIRHFTALFRTIIDSIKGGRDFSAVNSFSDFPLAVAVLKPDGPSFLMKRIPPPLRRTTRDNTPHKKKKKTNGRERFAQLPRIDGDIQVHIIVYLPPKKYDGGFSTLLYRVSGIILWPETIYTYIYI